MSDRYCIIDTDCGIDDSQAIMIAICQKVNILAITCVTGSVHVDQVVKNVAYVLKMCNRSDIPVYKGAAKPILGKPVYSTEFHGRDGLGDIPDREDDEVFLNQVLKDEDGISTLVRLVNEYEGKIDIASIAPLTNIALAQRLDSNFASKLSSITIMGGNHEGKISCSNSLLTIKHSYYVIIYFLYASM